MINQHKFTDRQKKRVTYVEQHWLNCTFNQSWIYKGYNTPHYSHKKLVSVSQKRKFWKHNYCNDSNCTLCTILDMQNFAHFLWWILKSPIAHEIAFHLSDTSNLSNVLDKENYIWNMCQKMIKALSHLADLARGSYKGAQICRCSGIGRPTNTAAQRYHIGITVAHRQDIARTSATNLATAYYGSNFWTC